MMKYSLTIERERREAEQNVINVCSNSTRDTKGTKSFALFHTIIQMNNRI